MRKKEKGRARKDCKEIPAELRSLVGKEKKGFLSTTPKSETTKEAARTSRSPKNANLNVLALNVDLRHLDSCEGLTATSNPVIFIEQRSHARDCAEGHVWPHRGGAGGFHERRGISPKSGPAPHVGGPASPQTSCHWVSSYKMLHVAWMSRVLQATVPSADRDVGSRLGPWRTPRRLMQEMPRGQEGARRGRQ